MPSEYAKQALAVASSGLHALETIGAGLRSIHGLPFSETSYNHVMGVVSAINAVVTAFERGLSGDSTSEEIDRATTNLRDTFAANDAAARAIVDARFPR